MPEKEGCIMKKGKLLLFIILGLVLAAGLFLLFQNKAAVFKIGTKHKTENMFAKAEEHFENNQIDDAVFIYEDLLQNSPDSEYAGKAAFNLGRIYEQKNMPIKAKSFYSMVINKYFMDSDIASKALKRLGDLNVNLFFSTREADFHQKYVIRPNDTLHKIAKNFNTTVDFIMRANRLNTSLIRPNMELVVPKGKFSVLVDKTQLLLTVKLDEKVFKVYKVSTGKDNCTPVGVFTIVNKLKNPTWYKAGAVIPPDSEENILGTRWMGFSNPTYGIHGTTNPQTIGTQETAGCVRMKNEEVEELYDILPVGTEVTIID